MHEARGAGRGFPGAVGPWVLNLTLKLQPVSKVSDGALGCGRAGPSLFQRLRVDREGRRAGAVGSPKGLSAQRVAWRS